MNSFFSTPETVPLILGLIAFLLGSIPFGVLISRAFDVKDLTRRGSGNIGASNVSRVAGFWPAGFLTLFLDVSKGALPVFLASPAGHQLWGQGLGAENVEISELMQWTMGFLAVLGHCFSPWLRFRGGKGVATSLGVFLVLSPVSAGAGVLAFAVTFYQKRIASLSSLMAIWVFAMTYLALNPIGSHLWMGAGLVFLILLRHESNIDALLTDAEKPI